MLIAKLLFAVAVAEAELVAVAAVALVEVGVGVADELLEVEEDGPVTFAGFSVPQTNSFVQAVWPVASLGRDAMH